jgi:hypothetical protein
MKKKICYLIYSTLLVSCSLSTKSETTISDPFFEEVLRNVEGIESHGYHIIDPQDSNILMPMHLAIDKNQNIVVVDGLNWNIHLLNTEGETLSKFGKIGSGPREFQQINFANLTPDQNLIIGDLRSQRITILKLHADSLEYLESFMIENATLFNNINLSSPRTFTKIEDKYFGLYLTPKPDSEFVLVEFDNKLHPQNTLMNFPVHHMNGIFSNTSLTDMSYRFHGDTFIQVYYDSLMVQSYNLLNYENNRDKFLKNHPDRFVSEFHAEELNRRFNGMEVNTNLVLPIIRSGYSNDTLSIFPLDYFGGDYTPVIIQNKKDKSNFYLKAPKGFYLYSYSNNLLAGIIIDAVNGNSIVTMNIN